MIFGSSSKTRSLLVPARGFAYKYFNHEVELGYLVSKKDKIAPAEDYANKLKDMNYDGKKPPMIVIHGLLGSMLNWRSYCHHKLIVSRRDCFLPEMRNHPQSDHHEDFNYQVLSDDIIRFADKMGLDKFTLLGHSMGGRTALTCACRRPDRVDGVISVDAAPLDESDQNVENFLSFKVIELMNDLTGMNAKQAIEVADNYLRGRKELVNIFEVNRDR